MLGNWIGAVPLAKDWKLRRRCSDVYKPLPGNKIGIFIIATLIIALND